MSYRIHAEDIDIAYDLFHNGILALYDLEKQGFRIDMEYIDKQKKSLTRRIKHYEDKFAKSHFYYGWRKATKQAINIYSPQQLSHYLYKVKKLKPIKDTDGGQGSTDEESLSLLQIPDLNLLLKAKKLKKIRDTFLAGLERETVDGYVHPFFNLHLVITYRGSSDSPNFQNIPKRNKEAMQIIRGAIFPRKGNQILELDYGQLEVRIAACYHQDPTMIEYLETGHDMHADVAKQLFMLDEYDDDIHGELRKGAKNSFVFPQFYGDYYKNNAETLTQKWCNLPRGTWHKEDGIKIGDIHIGEWMINHGIKSYSDFENHVQEIERDFWEERFPVYKAWKETWWKEYQRKGYCAAKTGFIFQGVMSRKEVINYPVQGAAFHCLLWSLIEGNKALKNDGMKTRIVGQIHDAIVLDVYPPELDRVIKIMKCIMENDVRQKWDWITVPLIVDAELCPIDGSWATKEKYKI